MLLRTNIFLIGCLMFCSQNICAQKSVYDSTEIIYSGNIPLNEIYPKTVRNFIKDYPDVHNEIWALTSKGYVASFTSLSKTYQLFFGKKGALRLTVISYDEQKYFPEDLKRLIAIGYPGSDIQNIVEVSDRTQRLYGITIANHQSYRLIEYSQNETKVVDEYTRQW